MAHGNARGGRQLLQLVGHSPQIGDAVVHEEDLSFAREFSLNRLLNAPPIVRDHFGHDRASIRGRGGERTNVAQSQHRHVQRARNRRRGKCEYIGSHAKLEQSRFVFDTKPLLFIHHN